MRRSLRGLRALGRHIGRRGACLLFFGLLALSFSVSFLNPPEQTPAQRAAWNIFTALLPPDVWGAIWIVTGLICIVQAFMVVDVVAFTLMAFLFWSVAAVNIVAWVGGVPRAGFNVAIFSAFGLLSLLIAGWRENDDPQPRNGSTRWTR